MALLIPEGSSRIGKVVGIDPGSNSLGFACIEFDIPTLEITKTYSFTIKPEKFVQSETITESHGGRYARIYKLSDAIHSEFLSGMPNDVVCESPFMSRRQPMAYGALMEVVYAVRQALCDYNPDQPLYLIDPPRAKQAVGAAGNAGKEEVLSAILKLEDELCFDTELSNGKSLKELDEHSSDAIAIAYSMINNYRGNKRE